MQRKWLSLPFLLLLPIVLVGLIVTILLTFFIQEDQAAMQIGIVDKDQSEETKLIGSLIEESSQLSSFMQLHIMSENNANLQIETDEISSYIVFPEGFTESLYTGVPVDLSIVGNPQRQFESYMIAELLDSVIRQIRDSQANILTLNHYAKELGLDDEERNDFVFEQFKEFVFYTLGRETIMEDREVINHATASPLHYFSLSSWFIITSFWLLIIYLLFTNEEKPVIKNRIKLYGVTDLQQITAKLLVTFTFVSVLSILTFLGLNQLMEFNLTAENFIRIVTTSFLHNLSLIILLAIIEVLVLQVKLRILIQSTITAVLLLLSGAIIPTIYFPIWIQDILGYIFSSEAFFWLTEVILNQRFYVDYIPLTLITLALLFILIAVTIVKERVNE